jgi:NADPH:quinone reductase-like Zn-dependent oxidoreductase
MKAFARIEPANQEVKLKDVPVPQIKPDEALIKVKAFGVGLHDRFFIPQNANFPYPIGTEGSGIITKVGNQVADFEIGDKIIFTTTLQPQGGSWAEYAAAKQTSLIPLPDNLTFAEGAAIPVAGKTALECMRALNLEKGESLFIAGASGAIGTFVIQLVKGKGIEVSASASEKNHPYMQSLGAEETVDYHAADWQKQIKEWHKGGVSAALAIQPGTGNVCMELVKDGGKVITVSGDSNQVIPERNITVQQIGHGVSIQRVAKLVNEISNGEINIEIEKEYDFEQALEALRKTETRHARGKVIVKGKK